MTANTPTGRGRQADQARRRQRLINTIQDADQSGDPVSVSSIARAAGVDRSFLYRHPDLLAQVHAAQSAPAGGAPGSAAVSHAALQADLANALDRSHRLAARVRQLEARLSEMLGEKAWHATGLGAPTDIDELQRKLARLEQAQIDLAAQLDERTEELRAAREANRELTRALNQRHLLFSQRGDVVQLGALPDHRVLVRFGSRPHPRSPPGTPCWRRGGPLMRSRSASAAARRSGERCAPRRGSPGTGTSAAERPCSSPAAGMCCASTALTSAGTRTASSRRPGRVHRRPGADRR